MGGLSHTSSNEYTLIWPYLARTDSCPSFRCPLMTRLITPNVRTLAGRGESALCPPVKDGRASHHALRSTAKRGRSGGVPEGAPCKSSPVKLLLDTEVQGILTELCDALHLIESRCCWQDLTVAITRLRQSLTIERHRLFTSMNIQGRRQCLGEAT